MATPAPSGRQTVLVSGDQRLVVVEVGGGIRAYTARGIDVVDGYDEGDCAEGGRGQPLLPWPNRLDGGRYEFEGAAEQAPLTEPAKGNAIHGLSRWLPWGLLDAGTDHAQLGVTLHPQAGWAWTLELAVTYQLHPGGLRVTTAARNRSDRACPFGAGWHPYLRAPSGRVDDLVLETPASTWIPTDDRGLPTGRADVAGTPWDFRQPRPIGDLVMDVALTDLQRGADGTAVVRVADPARDWNVAVRLGPGWNWLMVFTGDTLARYARRGVALEPMTCPANMLRTGEGRLVLQPGEEFEASWSIEPGWL